MVDVVVVEDDVVVVEDVGVAVVVVVEGAWVLLGAAVDEGAAGGNVSLLASVAHAEPMSITTAARAGRWRLTVVFMCCRFSVQERAVRCTAEDDVVSEDQAMMGSGDACNSSSSRGRISSSSSVVKLISAPTPGH